METGTGEGEVVILIKNELDMALTSGITRCNEESLCECACVRIYIYIYICMCVCVYV